MTGPDASAAAEPRRPSEILDKAADIVERVGWARDDWYDMPRAFGAFDWSECKVCAGGGINVAVGRPADFDDYEAAPHGDPGGLAMMALAQRLSTDRPVMDPDEAVMVVVDWNDNDERSAEEVVRELRAAAASEREAGR